MSRTTTTTAAPSDGAATLRQAADFLQVSVMTVRRLIAKGELRSFKVGGSRRVAWRDLRGMLPPMAG